MTGNFRGAYSLLNGNDYKQQTQQKNEPGETDYHCVKIKFNNLKTNFYWYPFFHVKYL